LLHNPERPSEAHRLAHRERGTVNRFHRQRGFGFITADSDGGEVFVHYTVLTDPPDQDGWRWLTPGQRVAYTRIKGNGHDRATDVEKL
jgi:CspA family cold shock protein